jgi:cytochrome P450
MNSNEPKEIFPKGDSIETLPDLSGMWANLNKLRLILSFPRILGSAKHGRMFRMGDTVLINGPKEAAQLAQIEKDFNKSLKDNPDARSPLGRGNTLIALEGVMGSGPLTLPTGAEWKTLNALLAKFIGYAGVEQQDMIDALIKTSKVTVERLVEALETGKPVDVLSIFKAASYEIVLDAVIGIDPNDLNTKEYFDALLIALGTTIFPTQIGISGVDNVPIVGRMKREAISKLDDYTTKVIDLAEQSDERNLVKAMRENEIPEETIVGTIHQIIAAGHETTAGTTTAILNELIKDPELWDRVAAEMEKLNVDYRDFESMHRYLAMKNKSLLYRVVYETLRLYPPTYLIPSSVDAEEGLVIGGVHLPKGTQLQIILANVHRDPRYFIEPDIFDADRAVPGSKRYTENQEDALMPFWDGPRRCAGGPMAMIEMFMLAGAVVQSCPRMEISKNGKINLLTGVTTLKGLEVTKAKVLTKEDHLEI